MLSLRAFKSASKVSFASKSSSSSGVRARRLAAPQTKVSQSLRFYADATHNASKIKVTLQTPAASIVSGHECEMVGVPGSVGEFAISPNSSPMFAELQAGVLRLINGAENTKYFVSGGFVASHEDSVVNISVGECVRLDDIDMDAARKIAAASQSKMTAATTEEERAIAQIGFDTATAMIKAIESK